MTSMAATSKASRKIWITYRALAARRSGSRRCSRNAHAYHGYNISNYLDVDPHFGTKQDLIDLVQAAHGRNPPMRVILDVVVNHSGDNWAYPGDVPWNYSNDQQFPFGFWRRGDRPIPTELRKESLYHRRGQIGNYDSY